MNLHIPSATRSRIRVAVLDALDVPDTPTTPDEHAAHAYALAVVSEFPGEAFELARAIDGFLVDQLHGTDYQFATVNPEPLIEREGRDVVLLALRLCGVRKVGDRWTDAPDNERTLAVELPGDLYKDWT